MFTPIPPIFTPPRVYVLKEVWQNPQAARRAERLAASWPGIDVRTFTYDSLPDIVVEEGWDHGAKMGTMAAVPPPIPVLGLFRFDRDAIAADATRMKDAYKGRGSFPFSLAAGDGAFVFFCSSTRNYPVKTLNDVKPCPEHVCRPQWRIHQGRGCPHQCAYCSLGGYLITHVNTEDYIDRLADLLAQNPWQKTWLYDDVMDVLTLEPELDTLAPLMRFFERTGDRYLILHTKSDRVHGLIEADAPHNTIIAWSLSGPTQSHRIEPVAGTTESRIEAARQCQDAGMTVRYKFKPIVPIKNWREEAEYTVDLALRRTKPDNLSMTTLMWMDSAELTRCIPEELLDAEFLQAARNAHEEMKDSRVGPYPHAVREEIYRHYLRAIRNRHPDIPVTISTESLDMWKSLGTDLGFTPATYVCGCGAGATPNLLKLQTNPWQDARAARTWDGAPAMPEGE
ncbi:MAG TPA: radical SAM protein [Candidatus Latescibacteria bacterium]|nr:radical SAM protein [Candidatus Latescibacterota bacterium]